MGEIKNQAIKNSVVSYFGATIGFVNFIILLPFVFTPEQIGLTRLLQNLASLLVPFAELGIISIVLRYYPLFKNSEEKRISFIYYCLSGAVVGFVFFCLCFFLFKDQLKLLFVEKSPLLIDYYHYIIPLVFFIVFTGIFEAIANSLYKTVFPNFLREVLLRVLVAVLAVLYVFHLLSFDQFVVAFVYAFLVPLFLLIFYLFKLKTLYLRLPSKPFDFPIIKEMSLYGLFVLLGSSGHLLVSYIDTIMVGSMLGLSETGIYVTAFYMAVVIEIPRRSITKIAIPFIASAWERMDLGQIKDIYVKTSLNQLIIGVFIFLGVWINIDEIFSLMPKGEVYKAGKFVVLFVMLGKLIDMASGANGEIIGLSKYYKFNMYCILFLAVLTVVGNYFLIPALGVTGAALATAISLFFYNLSKYLFIKITFKIDPFNWQALQVLGVGVFSFAVVYNLPVLDDPFIAIFTKSSVLSVFFIVPIYLINVSEDVNSFIMSSFNYFMTLFKDRF